MKIILSIFYRIIKKICKILQFLSVRKAALSRKVMGFLSLRVPSIARRDNTKRPRDSSPCVYSLLHAGTIRRGQETFVPACTLHAGTIEGRSVWPLLHARTRRRRHWAFVPACTLCCGVPQQQYGAAVTRACEFRSDLCSLRGGPGRGGKGEASQGQGHLQNSCIQTPPSWDAPSPQQWSVCSSVSIVYVVSTCVYIHIYQHIIYMVNTRQILIRYSFVSEPLSNRIEPSYFCHVP